MARILVNGISAKSAGGKSILTNFLKTASTANAPHRYFVVTPNATAYAEFASDHITLLPLPTASKTALIPFASAFIIPRIATKYGCDLVFNLADIPLRTKLPQVFLFDWPYAAFPDSPAWGLAPLRERIVLSAKLYFFKKWLSHIDIMIAQSKVIGDLLVKHFNIAKPKIVPNAVSLDHMADNAQHDFKLGAGYKLLCLSRYYPHKNLEILIPLAELIRAQDLGLKIITTISPADSKGARRFLRTIKQKNLDTIIVNLGTVPMAQIPSLYRQTDALLLPSLLESFSQTYIEAMFCEKPILTSKLPFAEAVCGTAAYYFDPHDPQAILESISKLRNDPKTRATKQAEAQRILNALPNWQTAYTAYTDIFNTALKRESQK